MKQSVPYTPLLLGLCSLVTGGLLWKSGVLVPPVSEQSFDSVAEAIPKNPIASSMAVSITPLTIAINPDKSGSILGNTSTITAEQLRPLVDVVALGGGEIAVGTICSTSEQPLIRQRIAEPPALDTESLQDSTLPEPVADNLNAFQERQEELAREQALEKHQQRSAANLNVVTNHEAAVAAHQQQAATQLTAFLETLQPTLEAPATCWETDLYGALARSSSFLNENPKGWNTTPVKFLIVISDGLDTADTPPVALAEDIALLVVGTQTEESIFQDIDHLAFENIQAAIAYVIAAVKEN